MDLTLPANRILQLDPNRPIYSSADINVDLFVNYRTKLFADKVRANFQLNVKNVQEEGGRLQKTSAFFDGRASTYRIVDPRQFILSASFDLRGGDFFIDAVSVHPAALPHPMSPPTTVAPARAPAADRWPLAGVAALVLFATLVAYLPALKGDFLWDDSGHVTRPDLQSWSGLARIWFELGATQQYY
eukprot:gene67297-92187_t